MIWTVFLLVHAVLLYFILTHRTRSKSEPPLDKGVIPWLGHALEFGKDASKFLNRMKLKHGDIFTVRAAGRYVTVLLDPHSYDAVINDPESLDFTRYARVLMERIFSLRLPHHQPNTAKAMMRKHFMGVNLTTLNGTMSRHLRALLTAEMPPNQKHWKDEGLFNFSYSLLFKAGYLVLFGGEQNNNNSPDPSSVYEEYKKFDGLLTKLARGTLKPEEKRTAHRVQQRLWDLLAPAGLTEDSGSSLWLHGYRQLLKEEGADVDAQIKALLMQLWATQGNVGPAAFWLLGYLLTNPEALIAVKKEFSHVSQAAAAAASETPLMDTPVVTPVFDSALEEAMRLTAAPFITREVVQDKTIHLSDGHEYLLRKGDRVCLFPFISPQMDPEIHREPQTFKYDRFLNDDGSAKSAFYKRGRRVKYSSMPFGAGTNGCVGKKFAIHTIREFVYLMLTHYDLQLCDPNAQMPEVNASRYGFGMLQPEGDLRFRYKPRLTHKSFS
ncbi:prostacyclin synthase [Solea senegalensis]|uniref:Prostacyclin synthase n=1 Tax=Solea senegalensis TaxID=28829 RepID=A0AAV6QNQ0_SOLSE|nr:prostacyclin synthase-like [Solea senegalensis]KAG7494733.1 prostacyclin synthase [Solea senegalensis]